MRRALPFLLVLASACAHLGLFPPDEKNLERDPVAKAQKRCGICFSRHSGRIDCYPVDCSPEIEL